MNDSGLISVAEAARRLGVGRMTGYRMARDGQLPGLVKLDGRQMRVRSSVLTEWLKGH
jgi:excisionase family DNA binding protein